MKSILCPFFYLIAFAYSHSSMDLASNSKVHTESHASSFSLLSRQPPKEANRIGDLSHRKCSCSVDVPHDDDTATRCSLPERQSKPRLFSSLSTIHGRSAPTLARGHLLDVSADPSRRCSPSPAVQRNAESPRLGSRSSPRFDQYTSTLDSAGSSILSVDTSHDTSSTSTNVENTAEIANFEGSKALLSPSKFPSPSDDSESAVATSITQIPRTNPESSQAFRYVFYPPRNPSDGMKPAPKSSREAPHRQLSYGQPPCTPPSESIRKSMASRELRCKAKWEIEDEKSSSSVKGNLSIPTIRPYYSEPPRKPRLYLDLVDEGSKVEKAVSIPIAP